MTPVEKQPRWENTTKCCAEAVSASIDHSLAILHLTGPTFCLHAHHWQSYGGDKSASPSHTKHVEIILVRLRFLSPGQGGMY